MKKRLADKFKFWVGESVLYKGKQKEIAARRLYKMKSGDSPEYRLKRFRNWIPEFGLDPIRKSDLVRKATPLEMLGTLTVIKDRYSGSYSGAAYLAFNLQPHEIPVEIWSNDIRCSIFWGTVRNPDEFLVGRGRDPMEAINDLLKKLK